MTYKLRNGRYMRQIDKNTVEYNNIYNYSIERIKNKNDYAILTLSPTTRIVIFSPPLTTGRL